MSFVLRDAHVVTMDGGGREIAGVWHYRPTPRITHRLECRVQRVSGRGCG